MMPMTPIARPRKMIVQATCGGMTEGLGHRPTRDHGPAEAREIAKAGGEGVAGDHAAFGLGGGEGAMLAIDDVGERLPAHGRSADAVAEKDAATGVEGHQLGRRVLPLIVATAGAAQGALPEVLQPVGAHLEDENADDRAAVAPDGQSDIDDRPILRQDRSRRRRRMGFRENGPLQAPHEPGLPQPPPLPRGCRRSPP